MSITSDIMLDSSILVEYSKNTQTELLDYLLNNRDQYHLCISETVVSECTFYWLAGQGGKAPYTLKVNEQIPTIIEKASPALFLYQFTVLPSDNRIVPIYLDLMERYNLLPNDALIIGAAKLHGISTIASYDLDFEPACAGEGIRLIRAVADLV